LASNTLQKPSSGDVLVNHEVVTGPDVTRAVVFQDHALLPWLNVADNVGFALQFTNTLFHTTGKFPDIGFFNVT
jgi:ABC-type taurine transport system ATPase subunit